MLMPSRFILFVAVLFLQLTQAPGAVAAPSEVSLGQITYISGGVGSDEAAEMKSMASRYALEVVSVTKAGSKEQYTADFRIVIKDTAGKTLIDAISEGPFFFANLPEGQYQVDASQDGIRKSQRVSVKRRGHLRLVFVWPQ